MVMTQEKTDVIVLAGGLATRLGALCDDLPKALLPVAGQPFLVWQVRELARSVSINRVILCVRSGTGNLFKDNLKNLNQKIEIIEENAPKGTGGAILSVVANTALSDPFVVINGDVLFRMDGAALLKSAAENGAALTAIRVPDGARFGTLGVGEGQVRGFREKTGLPGPGLISAGLYAFRPETLQRFDEAPSFERDIAPALVESGELAAVMATGPFIDIGTPESYEAADDFVKAYQG